MDYQLQYIGVEPLSNAKEFKFKRFGQLIDRIDIFYCNNHEARKDLVYLFGVEESDGFDDSIYISNRNTMLQSTITKLHRGHRKFFVQEFESYEEAYRVALMMREPSELCYAIN